MPTLSLPLPLVFAAVAGTAFAQPIDFNTQIRPLLSQNCTTCHGGVKAAGDISFVYRDVTTQVGKKSGKRVIIPGKPEESELVARITSTDPEYRMPPAEHGPALPPEKVALLREWIRQGAVWNDHWAFVPPRAPALPNLKTFALATWARSPIDRFVAARLDREKLLPAPEAARPALLRRVTLDLTGLPPTPEEVAAFVADAAPNAFEKQVDRLLASPHFGERWAALWLDLARYADTKGYEKDDNRTVWQYRDWLVAAFNRNLPYDRFVIEQLAGDLLPEAKIEQHVATAFHRQTQVNDEGGTDDEEYRTAAVIDRVATTWQVVNAVTFNCVQCHSHPYDPIKHEEYYRFFALFNETRDADFNNEYPTLRVPNDATRNDEAWKLRREIDGLRHDVVAAGLAVERDRQQWKSLDIAAARATPEATLTVRNGEMRAEGTIAMNARFELTVPASEAGAPITALRFEASADDPEKAQHTPERGFIITQLEVALTHADGTVTPVATGRFFPDTENFTTIATKAVPAPKPPGTTQAPASNATPITTTSTAAPAPAALASASTAPGTAAVNAPSQPAASPPVASQEVASPAAASAPLQATPAATNESQAATDTTKAAATKSAATTSAGTKSATTAKAGAAKKGGAAAAKAEPTETRDVTLDFHFAANPTISSPRWMVAALREPLVVPPGATLRITVVHGRGITEKPAPVRRLRVAASTDRRWTALATDATLAGKSARVTEALAELAKLPGTDLPVMAELPLGRERRQTRRFVRGNFLEKTGPALDPGLPALFPRMPAGQPVNRLTVAKWFFQPGQPLTARVAVNRFWEQLFGTGLVATLEDFGSVGDRPSHPELLDWLAVRFERELHWDMKALLRELVLSATYRQDAKIRPELAERDPQNRLLARGPRQRLTAEMVRDQALAASGLLSRKLGGPPVMPPQPAGVWQTVYNNKDWIESPGEDRYRRAVYTFWKRSAPYPGFLSFDMPARDLCTARRTPTNTPLQALVTLNDVVYQEAADGLATRVQRELSDAPGPDAQIARAFELVISRPPLPVEAQRLRLLFDQSLAAAQAVASATPPVDGAVSPQRRALSSVAAAILNLDAAFAR